MEQFPFIVAAKHNKVSDSQRKGASFTNKCSHSFQFNSKPTKYIFTRNDSFVTFMQMFLSEVPKIIIENCFILLWIRNFVIAAFIEHLFRCNYDCCQHYLRRHAIKTINILFEKQLRNSNVHVIWIEKLRASEAIKCGVNVVKTNKLSLWILSLNKKNAFL